MNWGEIAALISAMAAVTSLAVTSLLTIGKIGKMAGVMETTLANQNILISDLKMEIKEVKLVVTEQAVQTTRLNTHAEELSRLNKKIDELAHGEGFIFPLAAQFPPKTKLGG